MPVPREEIPADELRARDAYQLMTQIVVPRPIAWVSTVDANGRPNLAPFSYFQAVCSSPPTIVLGIGWLPDGRPKDTLANILDTRELTISHVDRAQADAMNATSAAYPADVSEWTACAVESVPAKAVAPSRVAGAVAGMECRLTHAIPLGATRHGTPSTTLVVARVVHFWLADGLRERDERGRSTAIDPAALSSVGRLGGPHYVGVSEPFTLARPAVTVAAETPAEAPAGPRRDDA